MNVLKTACHTATMDPATGHGFLLCPTASFDRHQYAPLNPPEPCDKSAQPRLAAVENLHRSDRREMSRRLQQLGWRICPFDDDLVIDGRPLLVLYTPNAASADFSLDAFVTSDAELRSTISREIIAAARAALPNADA